MATQTRRTTRRAAKFFRDTGKAYMATVWCGLVLMTAVAAHATVSGNGMPRNGMPFNGMPFQGLPLNGLPTQGVISTGGVVNAPTLPAVPQEGLPWSVLSQRPLGKHQPPSCKRTLCRP